MVSKFLKNNKKKPLLPFSVILHIVDTADKMSLNSNTNYLDSSLVPIVYRSLMFVINLSELLEYMYVHCIF